MREYWVQTQGSPWWDRARLVGTRSEEGGERELIRKKKSKKNTNKNKKESDIENKGNKENKKQGKEKEKEIVNGCIKWK